MAANGNKMNRRQFVQLSLSLACGLTLWRMTRLHASRAQSVTATAARTYGANAYGRGVYGATTVYLPLVTRQNQATEEAPRP